MTENQAGVLKFIIAFLARHDHSPSFREIQKGTGLSMSGVVYAIECLVSQGKITKGARRHRSIELVKAA